MIFGDFSIYSAPPLAIFSKETRFTIDSALHYVLCGMSANLMRGHRGVVV
jgi:hypothetical protein